MLKATTAVVVMIVGAFAGFAASALLYWVVVGLTSLMSSVGEAATSGALWQRAAEFGATFGLVTGGRVGLAGLYRWVGSGWDAAAVLGRVLAIALLAIAFYILVTDGRWDAIFANLGGFGVALIVTWLILSYALVKAVENGAPRAGAEAPL